MTEMAENGRKWLTETESLEAKESREADFGVVAKTHGRHPGGGGGANPPTLAGPAISGTFLTQNSQKIDFSGVKKWPKNSQK